MGFTVAIGSGVAIIPCGNTTTPTPYTRLLLLPHFHSSSTQGSRKLHVVCAKAETEIEEQQNDSVLSRELQNLSRKEPDFWQGEQWEWFGIFAKYSWFLGFVFGTIFCIYGCFTFHEPTKEVRERYERLYTVQSGKNSEVDSSVDSDVNSSVKSNVDSDAVPKDIFEEPDAYDSDVFDSNPTEVVPNLE